MIFIKLNTNKDIDFVHYMPFDEVNGLHKTKDELLQEGILVDSLPIPDSSDLTKEPILKYDGTKLYYEYRDKPLTPEQEIESLKVQNAQMLIALVQGGLM